jgi:uridine phosphorylase
MRGTISSKRLNVNRPSVMLRGVPDQASHRPNPERFTAPLLEPKPLDEPSVFARANFLREARRQRNLHERPIPAICILDPDGDFERHLRTAGSAHADSTWACYHTTLSRFTLAEREVGIVPFTVGAPFAVLVAEELMVSGCELLINLTSAGRIAAPPGVTAFMIIEQALRDEGTSYHYLPPSRWSYLRSELRERLAGLTLPDGPPILHGSTWTTDAPFRETATDVERHRTAGVLAVEMEAAALYAMAKAKGYNVLCLAHLTNALGGEGDFEKGASDGAEDALQVIGAVLRQLDAHSGSASRADSAPTAVG